MKNKESVSEPEKSGSERKKRRKLFTVLIIVLEAVLLVSFFLILRRARQLMLSEEALKEQQQAVTVLDRDEAYVPLESGQEEHEEIAALEKPPIYVDFKYLQDINPDVKAWLYCEDTTINFAIMQAGDNDYYLHHLADGSSGIYGSAFIDYRCSGDISDLNTLLYAHDMQNGSMFGGLELYRSQEYFEGHRVMYLLTPEHNYRLDAVCGYLHTYDTPLYELPATVETVDNSVWTGIARSTFDSGIKPSVGDRYVTLSTCADDYSGARYAIILRMTEIWRQTLS